MVVAVQDSFAGTAVPSSMPRTRNPYEYEILDDGHPFETGYYEYTDADIPDFDEEPDDFDLISCDEFFAGGVDDIEDAPIYRHFTNGAVERLSLDDGWWGAQLVETVSTDDLLCTQPDVVSRAIDRHLRRQHDLGYDPTASPGREFPWVVEVNGRRWVLDGHHRVCAAITAKHRLIRVRLAYFEVD